MKKVLSTKTLDPDALAYAQTQNLHVQCVDFIETRPVKFTLPPTNFSAIAFTSSNAVKYFFAEAGSAAHIKNKKVFAIQGKTADELLARGITADITGPSAEELGLAITGSDFTGSVLHICGNLRLPVLENKLKAAGIAYQDMPVYETILTRRKINESFDAVLFFSPSGVDGFMAMNDVSDNTLCCCIGSTTAQALKEKRKDANIITSPQPSPVAMLKAVANYWGNTTNTKI